MGYRIFPRFTWIRPFFRTVKNMVMYFRTRFRSFFDIITKQFVIVNEPQQQFFLIRAQKTENAKRAERRIAGVWEACYNLDRKENAIPGRSWK